MNGVYVIEVVLALVFLLCCFIAFDRDRRIRENDRAREEFYASQRMTRRIQEYGKTQSSLEETLDEILNEAA